MNESDGRIEDEEGERGTGGREREVGEGTPEGNERSINNQSTVLTQSLWEILHCMQMFIRLHVDR